MTVTVSTVNSTYELSQAFLQVCEDSLATTAGGIPDLSYVYPVRPPMDCAALIVFMDTIAEETTSPLSPPVATGRRTVYGRINLIYLTVWVLRCAPRVNDNGSIDLSEIAAVTQVVQQDGWAIWNGVYDAIRDGRFKDECSDVHFQSARAIREQGGCMGWEFTIRCELDGIMNMALGGLYGDGLFGDGLYGN